MSLISKETSHICLMTAAQSDMKTTGALDAGISATSKNKKMRY